MNGKRGKVMDGSKTNGIKMDGWMDGWMVKSEERIEKMDRWMVKSEERIEKMDGWMDGWWMNGKKRLMQ